jgi:hypothetical protein
LRFAFDRLAPAGASERRGLSILAERLVTSPRARPLFGRGFALGAGAVVVVAAIVAAGLPAREAAAQPAVPVVDVDVDPATLPSVVIDESALGLVFEVDDDFAAALALTLAENLMIEGDAMLEADGSILPAADAGLRLEEMQARLDEAIATGVRPVDSYRFDSMTLRSGREEAGQSGAALVIIGEGTMETVEYDPFGVELSRHQEDFSADFVLQQVAGDRWLIVELVPAGG